MEYNLGAASVEGLSEDEIITRRERGQGNIVQFQTSRTYLQIAKTRSPSSTRSFFPSVSC